MNRWRGERAVDSCLFGGIVCLCSLKDRSGLEETLLLYRLRLEAVEPLNHLRVSLLLAPEDLSSEQS